MATDSLEILKDKLDAFSRRLDEKTRDFEANGKFSPTHKEAVEKLHAGRSDLGRKLDSAPMHDSAWETLKREFEQSLDTLYQDLGKLEEKLDADARK